MTRTCGRWSLLLGLLLLAGTGCGGDDPTGPSDPVAPDRIRVQHVLIGFLVPPGPGESEGHSSVPGRMITRSREEAIDLAGRILLVANGGASFDSLVTVYSEDSFPGIYGISNFGVSPDRTQNEYGRGEFVEAFGDVGFGLSVGGIGLAEYDPLRSPFGWHVIRRLS